jgi:hypothetical protein
MLLVYGHFDGANIDGGLRDHQHVAVIGQDDYADRYQT